MPNTDYDAVPTIAAALSALHKSGGDKNHEAYKSYVTAVEVVARNYGSDAAVELQHIANNVVGKGDLNASLKRYAKDTLSNKSSTGLNKFVKNFLVVADQNENITNKYQYGFNMQDSKDPSSNTLANIKGIMQR